MFLFNNELTALKSVINKNNLIECNLTQEINKAGQLSILADLSLYKKTSDGDMIVVHDHDDEYLLFRIVKREALNDRCSILALEYGYYCLSVCDYIKDYRPHDQPMNVVLNKVLENTGWTLGKLDSFSNYTGTFYYQTPLECLSAIGSAKGCEFKFTVAMANNQITSKRLNVYKRIGQHLHKQFTLGMNALEVVAESDSTSIYKRALGRGKGEEVGDGYGRRIEFTDVVWSKASGNPVDKPAGQNWVEEDLTGNNYILPENKKPLKIVTFDEVEDPTQLLQLTYDWLINNNRPKLQLKTSVADAGELNLGDYVFVTRPDINLRYETRVFKINRNLLNHNLSTVEFGDNIAIKPMDKINDVSNRVEIVGNKVDQVQENVSIIDATGVKVNYGNSEPKDKKKGDIWFYTTEDGEEILLRWDGEKWVRVVDNKIIEEIETTVDNALKESEQAKQNAQEAADKANEMVGKFEENKAKLDQTIIRVDDISTNIGHVTDRVQAVDSEINNVKTDIGQIQTSVGSLDTTIGTLNNSIGKINTDIHEINNKLKAPNIINNPDPMFELKDYPYTQTSQLVDGWAQMDNRANNKEIIQKNMQMFDVTKGEKYTVQVEIQVESTLNSLTFSFYTQANNTHNTVEATLINLENGHYIAYASWVANLNSSMRVFNIKTIDFTGDYIQFRHPKLEKGNYSPYYLDGNFTIETVKKLEETSDGLIAEVSGMQVSNPNLMGDKEPMIQLRSYPGDATSTNENGWAKFDNTCQNKEVLPSTDIWLGITEGKKYTQQIEIQTDGELTGLSFTFFISNTHNEVPATLIKEDDNKWIAYASWTSNSTGEVRCIDIKNITITGGSYVQFRHPKIEEGEYTPYNLKNAFNNLTNSVSKVEITMNGVQSTVLDNTGKITQLTHTVEGVNSKVQDNTGRLTEVTQTIGGINNRVEAIENMNNGNRNLFIDSNNMKDSKYWSLKGGDTKTQIVDGMAVIKKAWGGPAYSETQFVNDYQSELKVGQNYTFSLDVLIPASTRLDNGTNLNFYSSIFTNAGTISVLNDLEKDIWHRLSIVVQYLGNSSLATIRPEITKNPTSGVVKLRRLKMEVGNKATDYDSISINFSQIQQQVDSIKQTVQSQDGRITEIEQTADNIQHTVENQNGQLSSMQQTINGMQSTVTDASNKVTQVTQTVQGIQSTVSDNTGKITQNTQTIEGLQQRVQDAEGNISDVTQTVQGIQGTVQDNANNISQVTQTAQTLQQKVTDNENNITQITQTSTAIQNQIRDLEGNVNTVTSTVAGTTQRVENIEGQITEISHTVDGVNQTVQNQNGQLSSMQQNIDGFKQTVESMVGTIQGINLIGNKDPMVQLRAYPSDARSTDNNGYARFSGNLNGQEILPVTDINVSKPSGAKLTQQIEVHTDGTLSALTFTFYNGSHHEIPATLIDKGNGTWVAHGTWTTDSSNNIRAIDIKSITVTDSTYVEFRRPKIEEGGYTAYDLTANEIDKIMSSVEQTAQGVQTTVTDNANKITQVTQSLNGIVSKVESNTNELNGADYNLIESFEITPTLTNTGNHFERESNNINGWATFIGSSFANKTLNQVKFKEANGSVTRKEGLEYTLSFEVNTNCDIFGDDCYIKVTINDQQTQLTSQNVIKQSEEDDVAKPGSKSMQYTFKYTFTPTADFVVPDIAVKTARKLKNEYNPYAHVSFRRFQVVEGTEVKGWGKQGGLKSKYTELQQTLDGFKTTVGNQQGQISSIQQTVEGVQTTVANNSGQISNLKLSIDGLSSKVESVGTGNPNMLMSTDNFLNSTYWKMNGPAQQTSRTETIINKKDAYLTYDLSKLNPKYTIDPEERYTISFELCVEPNSTVSSGTGIIMVCFEKKDGTTMNVFGCNGSEVPQNWDRKFINISGENLLKSKNFSVRTWGDFSSGGFKGRKYKLEKGDTPTEGDGKFSELAQTVEGIQLKAEQNGQNISKLTVTANGIQSDVTNLRNNTSAQLNHLADRIALRVSKNDVVNQINVSTEGIQISGEKIHISGRTTIDNAVIKDAMIANVSASKITAGTIDASKVNVINLNANNIIGNKTQFVQSAWNGINNGVYLDSNGLKIKNNSGENILFTNGTLQFRDRNNRELIGISRFRDGTVNLSVTKGNTFSINYDGQNDSDNTFAPALTFGGTNGTIRFASQLIEFQSAKARFNTMYLDGSTCPNIGSASGKVNIAWGDRELFLGNADQFYRLSDIVKGSYISRTDRAFTFGNSSIRFQSQPIRFKEMYAFNENMPDIGSESGKVNIGFGRDELFLGNADNFYKLRDLRDGKHIRALTDGSSKNLKISGITAAGDDSLQLTNNWGDVGVCWGYNDLWFKDSHDRYVWSLNQILKACHLR